MMDMTEYRMRMAAFDAEIGLTNVAATVSTNCHTVPSNGTTTGPTFPTLDHSENCEATTKVWPTPQPLPDGLPPVQPFNPDLLPTALRGWVMDIAHRMQCPPDFPAVGAITALSSIVGDDGLLQRFGLTVWPDIQREFAYVDQWPDSLQKQAAWAVYERLTMLQPASDAPEEWRFSPEAQGIFAEWMVKTKTELRGDELHPALVSHLDKYSKLVPALALIFALVDTPDSGNVIHEAELIRALAWADYLRSHAERLYSAATTPETTGAAVLLKKIQAGKLTDGDGVLLDVFTPRQVAVKNWSGLNTADAVRKAADVLVDFGWLVSDVVRSGPTGGRPSDRYRVNPAVMQRGTARATLHT